MDVFKDLQEWRETRKLRISPQAVLGFVPTMGALHAGHASLLHRARLECDVVVLSIFVNPTQFDNKDDLAKYPSTLEQDLALAKSHGVDYVILPDFQQIYPDEYRYKVCESQFSNALCGAHRPGHFDGVLTIVMKLFNLVQPLKAYFGEKDFQQLHLIKGMTEAFFMDIDIVPCATLRESDGLAMSSRNVRLSAEAREKARLFPRILNSADSAAQVRAKLETAGFQVDYVEDRDGRRYGAVHLGGVRLIDNFPRPK